MRTPIVALAFVIAAAGCGDDAVAPPVIVVEAPTALQPAVAGFLSTIPGPRLALRNPGDALTAAYEITIVTDLTGCAECYRVDPVAGDAAKWVVHGSDLLGAQYGLAEVFELLGYRFRHPTDTFVPAMPAPDPAAVAKLGAVRAPEMTVRGLHLHTLHPIEPLYALWEPTSTNRASPEEEPSYAARIFDWIVKNRGNTVQWVALDDILEPTRGAQWRTDTAAILEIAHERGLKAGLAFQLYGTSSLQAGYDLIDDTSRPVAEQIAERLPLLVEGVPFDIYEFSFGEFFGADPAAFIATIDETYDQLHALAPAAEVTAVIHVGDSPEQRVTYMNEDMIYYFLVKFANPAIVPQVHTVMYYNLFEDAGGAYHHDDFDEHRAFLFDRLRTGRRVQYKPETAYWVAFDNSVPSFLPLYVRSRWLDVDRIAAQAAVDGHPALQEQLMFSTGWEWGYWQNDVAALRGSFARTATYRELLADMYGPSGAALIGPIEELAEAQHQALIVERLAAYFAGRDGLIDAGARAGIIAAPDRIDVDDVAALTVPQRDAFATNVVDLMGAFAAALVAIEGRAPAVAAGDRWAAEVVDGIIVDRARAQFVHAVFSAALAAARGDTAAGEAALVAADTALAVGRATVTRRHADRHDRDPRLVQPNTNRTIYQYGYLRFAEELCFWERELQMARNAVQATTVTPPGCFL